MRTTAEILKAMEKNSYFLMTYFAGFTNNLEKHLFEDVTLITSPIQDDNFNFALSAKFTKNNVEKRVKEVMSEFNSPFSWWLYDMDTPDELEEILLSEGGKCAEQFQGMYLDLTHFATKNPTSLHVLQATTLERLKNFSEMAVLLGQSELIYEEIFKKVPPTLFEEGNPLEIHVGYLEDTPVAIGVLVLHASVCGLYYIATLPGERHRGFGTEMTEYLLERGKKAGYHIATLQASVQGKHMYERLGFKPCCSYKEYCYK